MPHALLVLLLVCIGSAHALPTDLPLVRAGYLGSTGADQVAGVAFQPDGHILVAGRVENTAANHGLTPILHPVAGANPDGSGVVMRLSADGSAVLAVARFAHAVEHMAVDPASGEVAVVGVFGLLHLSADLGTLRWSKSAADHPHIGNIGRTSVYSSGRRVAIGIDGTVAALFNHNAAGNDTHASVFVYTRNGQPVGALPITESGFFYNQRYEDVAVDSQRQQIILTGFRQASSNLQAPILIALSYAPGADYGSRNWTSFNWWGSAASTQSLNADSRGVRVLIGPDGALHFAGDVHGGDNRFTRAGPIEGGVTGSNPGPNLANVTTDGYTNHAHSQMSGFRGSYVARLDPANGEVLAGQFFHVRQGGPTSQKRSWRPWALAAGADGRLLFAGSGLDHFPCTAEVFASYAGSCAGDSLRINGEPIGGYFSGNPGVIGLSASYASRFRIAQFNAAAPGGTGGAEIRAIAFDGNRVLVAGHTSRQLVSHAASQLSPTDQDIWYALWYENEMIFSNGFE